MVYDDLRPNYNLRNIFQSETYFTIFFNNLLSLGGVLTNVRYFKNYFFSYEVEIKVSLRVIKSWGVQ
jgi:hypothetical protein